MFETLRIVLVDTSHPGNIGAAARAMKAMRLTRLYLVTPKSFPSAEASARATGADDLLYEATVCESLEQALVGCSWVVGTTARPRHIESSPMVPADWAARAAAMQSAALVFGRESAGLSNAELDRCHALVRIPTNPQFSSLNLASAVQIMAYEYFNAVRRRDPPVPRVPEDEVVSFEDMEGFYAHLDQTLIEIGYLDTDAPKLLRRRLRRIFNRIDLDRSELNILRGILSATQRFTRR